MRRARVNVFVHFVWTTWDRLPLLNEAIHRVVHRAIAAKCDELGAELISFGGMEDHVHILVRVPATITIADLVGQIKGASSHAITHEVLTPNEFFKWQGAYGAFSVSRTHLTSVCEYIKHQREHHASGTTSAAYEPSTAPDPDTSPEPEFAGPPPHSQAT
jgi:REP element-mobilizing transposase RayT